MRFRGIVVCAAACQNLRALQQPFYTSVVFFADDGGQIPVIPLGKKFFQGGPERRDERPLHLLLKEQVIRPHTGLSRVEHFAESDAAGSQGYVRRLVHSGDTLFAGTCGRCDLLGGSMEEMFASLKRLGALEGDFQVYPGHGHATTLETERRTNPYMRQAMQR